MARDLAGPLEVAMDAAREAGALLRREFHGSAGPRGHGDHADVDVEIERLIRERLLAAFPSWGYRGEETGSTNVDPPPAFVWLVDPNDGTRNFLEGCRGSSVSIALLHDRQPVLGVVYSPCAPDDDGDLFVWAEGCGPPRRNGHPIRSEPWPEQLGPQSCLLVSQDADRSPMANLQCAAPARYRPMPSIAYRLALAAGGDGTVGTSFKGAGDWDYAGGHALLRATGADLFDQTGAMTVYSPRGESRSRGCFGGPAPIVAQLVGRSWHTVYQSGDRMPRPPAFLRRAVLARGRSVADAALLRRAQGCLLGQLAGDALGSLVEFQAASAIRQRYPLGLRDLADGGTWGTMAGQPTDDSELALALARTIVAADHYDPETAAAAYAYWYRSNPFDIGSTTARALHAISAVDADRMRPVKRAGLGLAQIAGSAADPSSESNGSLMRASPLGIWGWALDPNVLAQVARTDSRLTHPNSVCQEACAAYVVAVAHAVGTGDGAAAIYEFAVEWARRSGHSAEVVAAIEAAAAEPPEDFLTHQGWVLVALQNAFHQLLHAPSAEEGIIATVMAGGDADTNAAIAGALLGAAHGRESIPPRWRNLILTCRPLQGAPGVARPRPSSFWPVDALELAELLLLATS